MMDPPATITPATTTTAGSAGRPAWWAVAAAAGAGVVLLAWWQREAVAAAAARVWYGQPGARDRRHADLVFEAVRDNCQLLTARVEALEARVRSMSAAPAAASAQRSLRESAGGLERAVEVVMADLDEVSGDGLTDAQRATRKQLADSCHRILTRIDAVLAATTA